MYSDTTKRLWVTPTGHPIFPDVLDTDATKTREEKMRDSRVRPLSVEAVNHQLARMCYSDEDNHAPIEKKMRGSVYLPKPFERLRRPFKFEFDKQFKDALIASARSRPGDSAQAVREAYNQIAVVNFLEKFTPRLRRLYEYQLYIFETASWSQQEARTDLLSLLRYLRYRMDDNRMKDAIHDALGGEVEKITPR